MTTVLKKKIFDFIVPGHATKREWAVYVIAAKKCDNSGKTIFYVGKVGDNREGCNPIISRMGNHFSHNKSHSQLRNKLNNVTNYSYKVYYATFGNYSYKQHRKYKDKINELESELNRQVQSKLNGRKDAKLLNPLKGKSLSKVKRLNREDLLTDDDKETIELLAEKATEQCL